MTPIRPEVGDLLRRRASVAASQRPRRRLMASGACALIIVGAMVAFGSSSEGGFLSPDRAVARAVQNLDGTEVLHWIHRGEYVPGRSVREQRDDGYVITEQWVDLANGDSHTTTKTFLGSTDQPSTTNEAWSSSGHLWTLVPGKSPGTQALRQIPSAPQDDRVDGNLPITSVADVRAMLQRAERGQAEIADAGEYDGAPLVVVTDRSDGGVTRTWITRQQSPRVVKITATVRCSPSAQCDGTRVDGPTGVVTTSTVTQTWQVLARTEAALSEVALPQTTSSAP